MAENREEDVKLGANKFTEKQPLGTAAQTHKDYKEPPPAPLFEPGELKSWSFYRAGIAEFMATFLFLYITILTVMGVGRSPNKCASCGDSTMKKKKVEDDLVAVKNAAPVQRKREEAVGG